MTVQEELLLTKVPSPGHELALSILLTRELLGRLLDERIFRTAGTTDPQFNILRILKGGPPEGYTIGELKRRVLFRNADLPRLIDRMVAGHLVQRTTNPQDGRSCLVRLAPEGVKILARVSPVLEALMAELDSLLGREEGVQVVQSLDRLREGLRGLLPQPR